jgi:O-antigen/teichoic acid export membrane protein
MTASDRRSRLSRFTPAARRLGGVSLAEVASRAVGFVAFPFITRALGPTEFGSLSFAVAVTSWAGLLSAPGVYAFGLREVAQSPEKVRRTSGELIALSLAFSLLAYAGIVAWALLAGLSATDRTLLLLTGATIPVSAINLSWAFIGLGRAGAVSFLTLITNVLYAVLVIVAVKEPSDVTLVAALQLLQFALIAAGLLILAHRDWGMIQLRLSRDRVSRILRGALPLGVGAMMTMIYNRLDLVMIAAIRGRTEAGWYGGAYRLMEIAVLLPIGLLSISIMPSIMAAVGRDRDEAARKAETYWRHFLVLAIPVMVGGFLLRDEIVTVVLGDAYAPSADVFGVLSANLLIGGAAAFFAGSILVGLRQSRAYLAAVALGAVVNVILNLIWIPRYGMTAAAIATLVAQAAVAVVAFVKVRRYIDVDMRWARHVVKPLIASAFMSVPIILLNGGAGGLWLSGAAGFVTYAVVIALLRGVDFGIVMHARGDAIPRDPEA